MLMFAEQLVAGDYITWTLIGANIASLFAHHGVYLRFDRLFLLLLIFLLSSQGFFFYIADESMGGVYMTLLNSSEFNLIIYGCSYCKLSV